MSVSVLYVMANKLSSHHTSIIPLDYILTLICCLSCNIFITGLNQIYDVEIDRLNKPKLPLVTGEIQISEAKKIVTFCLMIALVTSYYLSYFFGGLITVIALIGAFYTIPPVRLKRYHLAAALAISIVRGPLVNLGIYIHFHLLKFGFPIQLNHEITMLTAFITVFSIGIAWFKDIPDVEGDKINQIETLSVKYSKKTALWGGLILVSAVYMLCILNSFFQFSLFGSSANNIETSTIHKFWFGLYHLCAWIFLIFKGYKLNIENQLDVRKFYMTYWILFFLEYIAFAIF